MPNDWLERPGWRSMRTVGDFIWQFLLLSVSSLLAKEAGSAKSAAAVPPRGHAVVELPGFDRGAIGIAALLRGDDAGRPDARSGGAVWVAAQRFGLRLRTATEGVAVDRLGVG